MPGIDKIGTCLWFETGCVEAAGFYVSIFNNSRIIDISTVEAGPTSGTSFVTFQIEGRLFSAMDGGSKFQITPAISFVVHCDSQQEIDRYWDLLSEGGHEGYCGWLTDRFGVSWQIIPADLSEILKANPKRATEALFTMTKINVDVLRHPNEM